jgi:4-hydroxybenzoate polyprenyltransferase
VSREDIVSKERLLKFGMALFVWAIVIVFRLAYLLLPYAVATVSSYVGIHGVQLVLSGIVVLFGFLAYEVKKKKQLWYGRVEICFGIGSAIALSFSVSPGDIHLTQWASLVGCIYVIARGMNNVNDALGDGDGPSCQIAFCIAR